MLHPQDETYAAAAAIAQKALPGWRAVAQAPVPAVAVTDAVPGLTLSQLQAKHSKPLLAPTLPAVSSNEEASHLVKMALGNGKSGPRETVVLVSGGVVVARQG